MDKDQLSYEEILEIMRLFDSSSEFSELRLKYGSTEINLRKQGAEGSGFGASAPAAAAPAAPPPAVTPQPAPAPAAPPAPAQPARTAPASSKVYEVKSPTVGTFYRAPEPAAAPFVSVGQRVQPDTTVCIVEVMKLMNSIQANCTGTVTQVLVNDSEAVEFGQVLILIEQD